MFIDVDSKKVIILVDGILKVKISRGEKKFLMHSQINGHDLKGDSTD